MIDAPLFEFRHVTVFRDETPVLSDFSLTVPSGQNLAILGPNGSGKSTLIKLITRELFPVDDPRTVVRVLGRNRWLLFELREQLGLVSNDLMSLCTRDTRARDLVVAGFFGAVQIWPHHVVSDEQRARAEEVLGALDVGHLASRPVDHLSSGEARRVLIARALVHRPRALILDEPTNSLDLRAFRELRDALRVLAQGGTNIVLVTHHLPDIIPEIARVVVLREGRIQQDGPTAEVLTAAVLSDLFGISLTVEQRDGFYEVW
jgi:iron complex transport system ATP-binding protein